MEQKIKLACPEEATSPSSISLSDIEDRFIPFTHSPLDICRGGKQKTPSRVRDGKKNAEKASGLR
jgi:hypothetical protein